MAFASAKSNIKLEIFKEYSSDVKNINFMVACSDGSVWIGDNTRSKLQHVKLTENKTEVITSLNTNIYGIAISHSNNILVKDSTPTKLRQINTVTGEITDSIYDIKPLKPVGIHVTSDHRVIIGASSPLSRVVIVLDQEGKQLKRYENDKHNKRLFTLPRYITSTSNGNICVVDTFDRDFHGRVVVLSPGGDIIGTYTGHPEVNTKKKPFKAFEILTTPSDNIVVTDTENHLLHILSDQGQIITYYNLSDMGILRPHSLTLSSTGTILIGCLEKKAFFVISDKKAKLYELEYSGF
ncbi:uncharacterized protein LOC134693544 [Mytilus trossulus]|uniref:uncharacterized protein LOC134693544 n=1 Tax=Mytilus trossulus TaxID=6551 RepID=UPI0030067081